MEHELLLAGVDEPFDFEQAIKEKQWKRAMQQEIESIKTGKFVDLPTGHKPIGL